MSEQVSPSDIPVVILCGGQGTRIREASESLPKPLIDIGGKPILWHIMKSYHSHGFRRFILCLGYKGWNIKEYFLRYQENVSDFTLELSAGNGPNFHGEGTDDFEVSLVDTGLSTGTGGRIPKIAHLLDQDYFMLTYGDGLGPVNVGDELQQLAKSDKLGMVTGVHPTSRFGELHCVDGMVENFAEKPASTGWVSGGFFAFRKEFLDYLDPTDPGQMLESHPLQQLARDRKLSMYEHDGFWMGMDTFREYTALNEMWAADEAPWKTWE